MKKYFTYKQTSIATFIGGPLAGGLLIYSNLRKFKQKEAARIALSVSVLLMIISFVVVFNITDDLLARLVGTVFTGIFTAIAYYFQKKVFNTVISKSLEEGDSKAPVWKVALYSIGGIVLTLSIALIIGLNQPDFPGSKLEFGESFNAVYYDEGNVSLEDIQKVASILKEYGYFDNEVQRSARLEKENKIVILKLLLMPDVLENPEIVKALHNLNKTLEFNLKSKAKVIVEYYDLGGKLHQKTY